MPMYDLSELKELIKTIDQTGVTCFEIKGTDGEKLTIKKEKSVVVQAAEPVQAAAPAPAAQAAVQSTAPEAQPDDGGASITAPMVGVFYAAASPDAQPYVTVGSSVKKGDVICIIEAMKLMNEITAAQSGTITEVCAQNGDIVEFGQPLFKIK